MKVWIKIDLTTGLLSEINQAGLIQAAKKLKLVIESARSSGCEIDMKPIEAYADSALRGEIKKPRDWNGEPLRGQFREGLLPLNVDKAYANFTFYSHGLLNGEELIEDRADGKYAFVGEDS